MSNWEDYIQLDESFTQQPEFHERVVTALDKMWSTPEGREDILQAYENGGKPLTLNADTEHNTYNPYTHMVGIMDRTNAPVEYMGEDGNYHTMTLTRSLTHEIVHAGTATPELFEDVFKAALEFRNEEAHDGKFDEFIANLPSNFIEQHTTDIDKAYSTLIFAPSAIATMAAENNLDPKELETLLKNAEDIVDEYFIETEEQRAVNETNPPLQKYHGEEPRGDYRDAREVSNWTDYISLDESFDQLPGFREQVETVLNQKWATPEGKEDILATFENGGSPLIIRATTTNEFNSAYDPYSHTIGLSTQEINNIEYAGQDGKFHEYHLNRVINHEIQHATTLNPAWAMKEFKVAMHEKNIAEYDGKFTDAINNMPDDFFINEFAELDRLTNPNYIISGRKTAALASELGIDEKNIPYFQEMFNNTSISAVEKLEEQRAILETNHDEAKYNGETPRAGHTDDRKIESRHTNTTALHVHKTMTGVAYLPDGELARDEQKNLIHTEDSLDYHPEKAPTFLRDTKGRAVKSGSNELIFAGEHEPSTTPAQLSPEALKQLEGIKQQSTQCTATECDEHGAPNVGQSPTSQSNSLTQH